MDPISSRSGLRTDLTAVPTTARPTPSEGVAFRDVVGRGAQVLAAEAQSAVIRLPGGPLLAAAVRPGANGSVLGGAAFPSAGVGSSGGGAGTVGGAPASSAASTAAEGPGAGGLPGAPATSVEGQLAASQDMNLYYLQLQEAMSAENRSYSACSNVLKARHDTVKNAIGNIR